ncbi:MAG: MalY/PatB family protein [Eubacteriales bacterium]|nr:MalY/PatB family protein [Eubacteriales bacterium]
MKYDFDKMVNRRGTNSLKWNVDENELPMWVADMDFQTAPEIVEAMQRRLIHGVFGYSDIPDEWSEAYVKWWKDRHQFQMEKEELIFCTGVVPAISSIVRKLTTPAEKVLIQTPVYNIFFNSIVNNGRQVLQSPLAYDGVNFEIDFERLEKDLSDPQTSLMILCNPHNPVGKIWSRETLARIGELCKKYHVTVISDEIHCDLTAPGTSYIPFAAASDICREISITCIAPTKAFNIAGLQTAAVYVSDENLRHKVWRGLNTDEVAEPNAFAIDVAIAAFSHGENWLDELREYIQENKKVACTYIQEQLPELYVVPSEATYLLWIDCSRITKDTKALADRIRERTGLYLSEGSQYGSNGNEFLRLNVACPRERLYDGLERLRMGIEG